MKYYTGKGEQLALSLPVIRQRTIGLIKPQALTPVRWKCNAYMPTWRLRRWIITTRNSSSVLGNEGYITMNTLPDDDQQHHRFNGHMASPHRRMPSECKRQSRKQWNIRNAQHNKYALPYPIAQMFLFSFLSFPKLAPADARAEWVRERPLPIETDSRHECNCAQCSLKRGQTQAGKDNISLVCKNKHCCSSDAVCDQYEQNAWNLREYQKASLVRML